MNYFELFDIPVQLKVDKPKLASKYFELSRKHHPDYYINENPEKQQSVLEISAQLNKAYKTFQNTDETIKYTLQLKGMLQEEENRSGSQFKDLGKTNFFREGKAGVWKTELPPVLADSIAKEHAELFGQFGYS